MKLLYVFEERASIFIELAWGISLSSASRLLAATILAGALAGSAMAQAPDAGCALPSEPEGIPAAIEDRKSTRLNSSHQIISYAVFCLKKKKAPHGKPRSPPTALHAQSQQSTPTAAPS